MNDIWGEKPESFYKELGSYGHYYEAGSMDRWLDKVQQEHAESDGSNFVYFSLLNDIRKFAEGQRMLQSVTHQQIANQILKILEPFLVSDFHNKG